MDHEPIIIVKKDDMMHKVGSELEGLAATSVAWWMAGQEVMERRGLHVIIL